MDPAHRSGEGISGPPERVRGQDVRNPVARQDADRSADPTIEPSHGGRI